MTAKSPRNITLWNELSRLDPFFTVLSHARHRGGNWDAEEFFLTGEAYLNRLIARASGLWPVAGRTALDFGCGLGRITRALSSHFGRCWGVDISSEMIARAKRLNEHVGNIRFDVIREANLPDHWQDKFELVVSKAVLQHIPGRDRKMALLGEMVRVSLPGGLVVCQVPCRLKPRQRLKISYSLYTTLRRIGIGPNRLYRGLGLTPIPMYALSESRAISAIRAQRGEVRRILRDPKAPGDRTYLICKAPETSDQK